MLELQVCLCTVCLQILKDSEEWMESERYVSFMYIFQIQSPSRQEFTSIHKRLTVYRNHLHFSHKTNSTTLQWYP